MNSERRKQKLKGGSCSGAGHSEVFSGSPLTLIIYSSFWQIAIAKDALHTLFIIVVSESAWFRVLTMALY